MVYLEVIDNSVILHTILTVGLKSFTNLKSYRAFTHLLSLELMEKGINSILCFVETDTEIRFAEFFGFKMTNIVTNHAQNVMIKDITLEA